MVALKLSALKEQVRKRTILGYAAAALEAGVAVVGVASVVPTDAQAQNGCYRLNGSERRVSSSDIQAAGTIPCDETVIVDGRRAVTGACNRDMVPLGSRYDGAERGRGRPYRIYQPICGR